MLTILNMSQLVLESWQRGLHVVYEAIAHTLPDSELPQRE